MTWSLETSGKKVKSTLTPNTQYSFFKIRELKIDVLGNEVVGVPQPIVENIPLK